MSVRRHIDGYVLAGVLLLAGGCSHSISVSAFVIEPAAVPVRAFPEIWVAGGYLEEEEYVLARLIEALERDGKHRVKRVEPDQLEPLRRAGQIPMAAVVLVVDVRILEDTRQSIESVPIRVCGAYGCDTQYQQVTSDVPWIRGVAILQVHEGPSAKLLQRHVVRTDRYGGDPFELRVDVGRRLAAEVAAAVEVREQMLQVRLFEVGLDEVRAAQLRIEKGDWAGGRAELERVVGSAQLAALPEQAQARVLYDLGLARRFAPTGGYSQHGFDLAEQAFRQAAGLDPSERAYEAALQDLAAHRMAHARLNAQREAEARNFALQAKAVATPPPPASYQAPKSAPAQAPLIPPAPPAGASPSGPPVEGAPSRAPGEPFESDFEPG